MAKHMVCVQMLLRGDKVPTTHQETLAYVKRNMRRIHRYYKKMHDLSITARYRVSMTITPEDRDIAMGMYRLFEAGLASGQWRG